jgi:hypothetical protein
MWFQWICRADQMAGVSSVSGRQVDSRVELITQWSELLRTRNHTLLSHLRLPQPGGPGSRIYIPQEQGGPVIPPSTGFPLHRLLRLAGVRWRYSNHLATWRARFPYLYPPGTGWPSYTPGPSRSLAHSSWDTLYRV